MNEKIVSTFVFGIGIGISIAVAFSLFPITIKFDDKLPDLYANFNYSCCFVNPELAEEVDKSNQPRAWIGYVESVEKEVYEMKLQRGWLPSHVQTKEFFDAYPVVEYVISGRTNAWISPDAASSILEYVNNGSYLGAGGSGHCGQYKYIRQNYLAIPMSKDSLAFVFVSTGDPARRCDLDPLMEKAYGPSLDSGSTRSKLFTLDFSGLVPMIIAASSVGGGVIMLALMWRGKVSRIWHAHGFDHEHFVLMVKMRGSRTRLQILYALDAPKTRQVLAEELVLEWKAIHRHIKVLLRYGLIQEVCTVGRVTYYERSENGNKFLNLLQQVFSSDDEGEGNERWSENRNEILFR